MIDIKCIFFSSLFHLIYFHTRISYLVNNAAKETFAYLKLHHIQSIRRVDGVPLD
jgi:hypothetical protein